MEGRGEWDRGKYRRRYDGFRVGICQLGVGNTIHLAHSTQKRDEKHCQLNCSIFAWASGPLPLTSGSCLVFYQIFISTCILCFLSPKTDVGFVCSWYSMWCLFFTEQFFYLSPLSLPLSIYISISIYLTMYIFIIYLSTFLYIYLSISLSIYLSISIYIYLSTYLLLLLFST
jgi:hypothetical protein